MRFAFFDNFRGYNLANRAVTGSPPKSLDAVTRLATFPPKCSADGTVIGQCADRHRHQEWLKFLKLIDLRTPADRDLHLILDNYATHKHPVVKKWLEKHPHFHLHFTPTSASWLNMVERFFRDLTVNRLRRGVFHSVPELVCELEKYIAHYNKEPTPFVWTAKAEDILAKVTRARKRLPKKPKAH